MNKSLAPSEKKSSQKVVSEKHLVADGKESSRKSAIGDDLVSDGKKVNENNSEAGVAACADYMSDVKM